MSRVTADVSERPTRLRLTELGTSPAFTNPGGACAGHLVRTVSTAILLDCGFGIAGRVRQHLAPDLLDAIVVSHLHPDHYMDLVPLHYGLRFGERTRDIRVPVLLPPGGVARLASVGRALDDDEGFFHQSYELSEYRPHDRLRVGDLEISFHPVQHYIASHAVQVRHAGRALTYSADAGPCAELVEAARGADLFLCEASLQSAEEDEPDPARRGHLTAAEAGISAALAGARLLLLTHSTRARQSERLVEARAAFGDGVHFSVEGTSYEI